MSKSVTLKGEAAKAFLGLSRTVNAKRTVDEFNMEMATAIFLKMKEEDYEAAKTIVRGLRALNEADARRWRKLKKMLDESQGRLNELRVEYVIEAVERECSK